MEEKEERIEALMDYYWKKLAESVTEKDIKKTVRYAMSAYKEDKKKPPESEKLPVIES